MFTMNKVLSFLNEVKAELFKVTWPSRDELIGSTIIVCLLVAILGLILSGMDAVFSSLIRSLAEVYDTF